MKTELELLKEKVAKLESAQARCKHEWGEPEYDPERKEITRDEFVYLGSDSYYKPVGTGLFENVDRWSRVCTKCGKKEYAYEQEEVAVQTVRRPKF